MNTTSEKSEPTIIRSKEHCPVDDIPLVPVCVTEAEKAELVNEIRNGLQDSDIEEAKAPIAEEGQSPSLSTRQTHILIEEIEQEGLNLDEVEFAEEIKIDFIRSIDYRIMCRFLGVTSVNHIKNHPYSKTPLITLLLMQSLNGFMESKGYRCVGELNFNREGESVPPVKEVWKIEGKELPFTVVGFKYFEKEAGKKKNNVVFWVLHDTCNQAAVITCFTTSSKRSENIIKDLET